MNCIESIDRRLKRSRYFSYKGYEIEEISIDEYSVDIEGNHYSFPSLDDAYEFIDDYEPKNRTEIIKYIDKFWYIYRIKSSNKDIPPNRMYLRTGTTSHFIYNLDLSQKRSFDSEAQALKYVKDHFTDSREYTYHVTTE